MSSSTMARAAGPRAKFALLLLGSFAGVMAAGAASAASPASDVPSVVVHYDPQSLATDAGVYALYRRITRAAEQVCPDPSIRSLSLRAQVEQCRNEAIARAVGQIDNSRLAALHAVRSKNG
jgi:UrcA family protein